MYSVMLNKLTELKVVLLSCKDDSKPSRRGAGERLAAAQNHFVFEETPPQSQLLLEGRLPEVLEKNKATEVKLTKQLDSC